MAFIDLTPPGLPILFSACLFIVWALWRTAVRSLHSTLRGLPGPPNASWLFGNLKEVYSAENAVTQERWTAQYGDTIKYKGWLSVRGASMLNVNVLTRAAAEG